MNIARTVIQACNTSPTNHRLLPMKPIFQRLALALAASAACDLALAQSTTEPGKTPTQVASAEIQKVDVTAHYDNAIGSSDAASQGTVRGERLTDLPLLRPGEVLETVPGLVVTQHSGDGKANQYFLRGYNLDHGTDFATFVDGVPANMPTNAHGQGYTDLNFLIPELVDRIDYRKGPYFAQDGDFASAGSAHIQYIDKLDPGLVSLTAGGHGYGRLLLAGSPQLFGANGDGGPRVLGADQVRGQAGSRRARPDRRQLRLPAARARRLDAAIPAHGRVRCDGDGPASARRP